MFRSFSNLLSMSQLGDISNITILKLKSRLERLHEKDLFGLKFLVKNFYYESNLLKGFKHSLVGK